MWSRLDAVEPLVEAEGRPLGRVGDLAEAMTLRAFSERLALALPAAPVGIRASGDPEASIRRVAVLGGSGDGEFAAAHAAGADVYVTADLRHHPAIEAREQHPDMALLDIGHWAGESLWLQHAGERLQAAVRDEGGDLDIIVSTTRTDPWDFLVGIGEGDQA